MKTRLLTLVLVVVTTMGLHAQRSLHELQQDFVDLQFGMFIHYNIPTYAPDDWPDPDLPASIFNPTKLDCRQWARAARSANMSYGCLTTKHHSGFCIWDTKTTDYNVMNSPLRRDVVREYCDAFRAEGLKVMLYYSILDTHHRLRPGLVTRDKVEMIKAQLHELLTNYGDITALIIDGWDAPWSRLSYDEVPFAEIYDYIKKLQPECLVMDLNAAKYPREALYYTDIKSYEQGAGQKISTSENRLPALACLSIQKNWFWKDFFPTSPLKDVDWLINDNIKPYTESAYCNFILNVAPNPDGLMDDNAVAALKEIGKKWQNKGRLRQVPECESPITGHNIAKHRPAESSWSWDYNLMDFANDDDFATAWEANKYIDTPWWQVSLDASIPFDCIVICERADDDPTQEYRIEFEHDGRWQTLFEGQAPAGRVKIHRFAPITASTVRITFTKHNHEVGISEFGIYAARR